MIWGTILGVGVASLLSGVAAGSIALGVARWRGYSWGPPRLLAARLLRRPYADVGRWPAVAVHFGLAVLALVAVGLVFLGVSVLTSVFGPAGGSVLVHGPAITAGLLMFGGIAAWLGLGYRWLPAWADVLDRPVATVRRQSAVVGVVYAADATVTYPFLLFLALMAVFFR